MSLLIADRRKVPTRDLREFAERRLRFALSRFSSRIKRIRLTIADENETRTGTDKVCCCIAVTLREMPEVVVKDNDIDVSACISRVADRAGRAVSRAIARSLQINRAGSPSLRTLP